MNPKDKWKDSQIQLTHRLLGIYLLFLVWAITLAGRLAYLQIYKTDEYFLKAEQQQVGFLELRPKRGDILDRNLDALAMSIKVDTVFAHPREILKPLITAQKLAPILEQDEHKLYKKLSSGKVFIYLARKITPRQSEQIKTLNLQGIGFQKETSRIYPGRELAAHVLGFVNIDNEGLSGLEYLYNDLIKGKKKKSKVHIRVDAKRQSYYSDNQPQQLDGNTIVLNIDRKIQHIVQKALEEAVESTQAKNGSAIVLDPYTGDILAMAGHPSFNPNRYSKYPPRIHRNPVILDAYEPGSTFKLVTFSAVLDQKLGDPSETIDCRVDTLRLAGKTYREAKNSFGLLTFNEVLAKSSNVGTIKLGLRLGNEKLYEYIKRFGFGQKTGVDLPGEQVGSLRPVSQWSKISIGALSIGQELNATPIQTARALSVIANGGNLIVPRVVRHILTPEGEEVFKPKPVLEKILDSETASQVKQAMIITMEQGTGKNGRPNGYSSAGKTGTAQKFIDGRYSETRYLASFAGFAPADRPALAAVVLINEPKGAYFGGKVAAPVFRQIMERSLIHLQVPRDQPMGNNTKNLKLQSTQLADLQNTPIIEPELPLKKLEETVLTLIQKEPPSLSSQTTFTVETNTFAIPDFSGMSLREVAQRCSKLGLRLKVKGIGLATGQRPAAGTKVSHNMVCEVFFSNRGTDVSKRVTLRHDGKLAGKQPKKNKP